MMITNNRKTVYFFLIPIIFLMAALLFSCTDFFSTSWASWASRDPSKLIPSVTVDNVHELIEMTENDPDMALEVLIKTGEAADKASGDDKAELQAAAVEAAVNAVGLGQTIINSVGELASIETVEDAKNAVLDAINGMPNLEEASSALYDLLPKDPTSEEFDNFVNTASAEEIALAAILLLTGEAKKAGDSEDYVDNFNSGSSPEAKLALDLAAALAGKEDEIPPHIDDILKGINLK